MASQAKHKIDMSDPDIIIIHVGKGEEKKMFQMLASKLRSKSSFFEDKFIADEALQKIMLPEDNPDAFGLLAEWLFTGSIEELPRRDENAADQASSSTSASTSQATPLTPLERKECIKIIKNALRTNDGNNFRAPVAELWPNFADAWLAKNPNPIDLRTMEEKLKDQRYKVIRELLSDIDLLLENSVRFNGDHHAITVAARKVGEMMKTKINAIPTIGESSASGVSPSASPAVPTPRTRFDTATSIKLAILAEKYCIAELADIAMNVLQCASGPNFVKYSAILAADKMISHSDSKLRLYLSRALACKLSRGTDHLAMPHLFSLANSHPQLGLETFRILAGGGKTRHPACFPPCDYHQHAKNEPCPTASKKRKREEDEDEETDEVEKIYQAVRRRERMILKAEFDEGSVARSHCRSTPK